MWPHTSLATTRGTDVDDSQRGGLTDDMRRSSGSFELVLSPVLLALLGLALDRWVGTVPLFTVAFAVIGFAGAAVSLYFRYQFEMAEHEARTP